MRTRKSNKTKSFKVETYDFDAELPDEPPEPEQPFADRALEEDGDFEVAGADQDESPDDEPAPEASASESSGEEGGEPRAEALVPKPKAPSKSKIQSNRAAGSTAYFGVEYGSVPANPHVPLGYTGRADRHIRGVNLALYWYGPKLENQQIALRMLDRWLMSSYLPDREEPSAVKKSAWEEAVHEREAGFADAWLERVDAGSPQVLRDTTHEETQRWLPDEALLSVETGIVNQRETFQSRAWDDQHTIMSHNGIPHHLDNDESKKPAGWLIDTGGLVTDLDWATRRQETTEVPTMQLLALAVIPHSDQEVYNYEQEMSDPSFQKTGTVQIWACPGFKNQGGKARTARQHALLKKQLCFDAGRVTRVAWSPVCEHLAAICGGSVYVVDVRTDNVAGAWAKVDQPLALCSLEDGIEAKSIAWCTFNRLVVGYSDGSIALWSVFPACILSRHAVHHGPVISIVTGYPTKPFSVASTPLGGQLKLFDLRNPSCETTEIPNLAVTPQPGLLQWSDHLKGFFAFTPSSSVINTTIGFTHHDFFPIVRRVSSLESQVTCISIGKTHPFLLIGGSDGSLTAMNPQFELFQLHMNRYGRAERLKIFQHEHQPAPVASHAPERSRGASRILHGFRPEKNHHVSKMSSKPVKSKTKKTAPKKKKKDEPVDDGIEDDEGDGRWLRVTEPKRAVVYEPLTRVTAVAWNPNEGYGTWAAASLGSGLVKIMDLGLETQ